MTARTPTRASPALDAPTPMQPRYNVISQLEATTARVSISELIKASPAYRTQLRQFLDQVDGNGPPRPRRVTFDTQPPKVHMFEEACPPNSTTYRPAQEERTRPERVVNHSSYAGESTHAPAPDVEEPPCAPSVTRVLCKVHGLPVVAIVDSGASHSVMAQGVWRKLQAHKRLVPTHTTFTIASGEKELPWGVLRGVPVTVGKLTLTMDLPVVRAQGYDLLLGNDWLTQSCCQMSWDTHKMRFMVSPTEYDEVDFDVDGQLRAPDSFTFFTSPQANPHPTSCGYEEPSPLTVYMMDGTSPRPADNAAPKVLGGLGIARSTGPKRPASNTPSPSRLRAKRQNAENNTPEPHVDPASTACPAAAAFPPLEPALPFLGKRSCGLTRTQHTPSPRSHMP